MKCPTVGDDMTCPSNSRCVDGDRNSRCECNPGFTQNRKGATMTCQCKCSPT